MEVLPMLCCRRLHSVLPLAAAFLSGGLYGVAPAHAANHSDSQGVSKQTEGNYQIQGLTRQIETTYQVKVLRIREALHDGRPVFIVTVMNAGGNFNEAFQVNTLMVDRRSGKLVSQFRPAMSGR
jgi:hypothetical protein